MRALVPFLLAAPALLGQTFALAEPGKPATLRGTLMTGSLRVVGHSGREVVVEGLESGPDKYPGMRRLNGPVDTRDNTVLLRTLHPVKGTVVVKLPYGSTVEVKCMAGGTLAIEDVRGPVEAEHMAGDIRIQGAVGTVAATAMSGSVTADLARLEGPVHLATMSGHITLSLPADAKADLKAHVDHASRFHSALPFQMESTSRERSYGPQVLRGTLNGGGTKLTLRCLSGSISIKKR